MQVNNYSLTIEGITVNYTSNGQTHSVELSPLPACQVLKELGVIKDFNADANKEPVIQLSNSRQQWHEFVKLFSIDTHLPGRIADHHHKQLGNPFRHSFSSPYYYPAKTIAEQCATNTNPN